MSTSLKVKNRWKVWSIIVANALVLHAVIHEGTLRSIGIRALFTDATNILPVGIALVASVVLNGLLSSDLKHRLVWPWRWRDPLPGRRAFSYYAHNDPRIDPEALKEVLGGPLPTDEAEQNKVWYRLYKGVEDAPAVAQAQGDFLLTRDYTGLAVLFLVFFNAAGFYALPYGTAFTYSGFLLAQALLAMRAAGNYGVRTVTTVLAEVSAKGPSVDKAKPKKK